ncbi:bifunctional NADH-specific enoyl-ACP reductase/trans-2-enoyl-CoA reductase [Streptomyces sp. NPDC003011]
MIIRQVTHGPLVVFAHPEGVRARTRQWAATAQELGHAPVPPRALVIGSSTGLGLAARVIATTSGSATIGVCHSRPGSEQRPGSAGWYATAETHALAERSGTVCRTVLADAFTHEAKRAAVRTVKETLGQVDLVVHSIAAKRRTHPDTGAVLRAVIKTVGVSHSDKTLDLVTGEVRRAELEPASPEEIAATVGVMGGEDWELWWRALDEGGVLAPAAGSLAFSYEGGDRLRPAYRGGTLGAAKDHLEATARRLDTPLRPVRVVVTSAHVTQSSSVIPITALYWTLLSRVLGDQGRMEGPVEQLHRLFTDVLPEDTVDADGRLRLDDRELDPEVQDEIRQRWERVTTGNLAQLGDAGAYRRELLRCAGFGVDGVDTEAHVDPVVPIGGTGSVVTS